MLESSSDRVHEEIAANVDDRRLKEILGRSRTTNHELEELKKGEGDRDAAHEDDEIAGGGRSRGKGQDAYNF